jgi:hypothetical protein
MDNTDSALLGAMAGFIGAMLIGFFLSESEIHEVEKAWCLSDKGNVWIDDKCYTETEQVKLK